MRRPWGLGSAISAIYKRRAPWLWNKQRLHDHRSVWRREPTHRQPAINVMGPIIWPETAFFGLNPYRKREPHLKYLSCTIDAFMIAVMMLGATLRPNPNRLRQCLVPLISTVIFQYEIVSRLGAGLTLQHQVLFLESLGLNPDLHSHWRTL